MGGRHGNLTPSGTGLAPQEEASDHQGSTGAVPSVTQSLGFAPLARGGVFMGPGTALAWGPQRGGTTWQ